MIWSQLQGSTAQPMSLTTLGCTIASHRGTRGRGSGPSHAQSMPPSSSTGYALIRTLCLNVLSGASAGWSTHCPVVSYIQPWYGHRSPSTSGMPHRRLALRWAQAS